MTTTRVIARPDRIDLDSPGRRDYWVALEHDSIWGDHLIPLTVWVGPEAEADRGLVAFGSNHGNEYEGPVVLKHLLREIDLKTCAGGSSLIPVLNPSAFRAGTRESTPDDGVNLNRAFVDGAGVTPALAGITHRIAAFVRQFIWPRVHMVLDLHSGGDVARFRPVANYHPRGRPQARGRDREDGPLVRHALLMVYQNVTPGLLPSEAERLGKITVGTELGWGQAVNVEGVRYGRQGVLAAAIQQRPAAGRASNRSPITRPARSGSVEMVDRDCFTVAPFAGHYEPLIECGTAVTQGRDRRPAARLRPHRHGPLAGRRGGRRRGAGPGLGRGRDARPAHRRGRPRRRSMNLEAAARPSRVRYRVLGFACALSMITYLDRACFGTAAPSIAAELGLAGVSQLKWAMTSFAIAYAAFEIPAGAMGDRVGPRAMLLRIVLWWSACTALTGVVGLRVGATVARRAGNARRPPVSLRRRRGRRVSEHHPGLAQLVPREAGRRRRGWFGCRAGSWEG